MLLQLDYKDSRPIYEQISDGCRKLILAGVLAPDEPMPSVRSMAMELSTNPNTVQKAYAELERQGVIYTVKGRGNFVSGDLKAPLGARKAELREKIAMLLKEADELGIDRNELLEGMVKK
ncbi:MAG: GntR family transcriptional regulator [Lachnospiraceae bacterium]|jgi:GntR family transcriptional regulator|nr:GntR family transcriptional regulator [Lachnospiraceae bacterium]